MQSEPTGRPKMAEEGRHAEGFPILVAGLGAVGIAVVHRLHALGVPVRAVLSPLDRQRMSVELAALGIDLVVGSGNWGADLARQDLASAGGVTPRAVSAATVREHLLAAGALLEPHGTVEVSA